MKDLFSDIKKAVASGVSEAIVFLSTGKDSLATLDLCARHMDSVVVLNMYYVRFGYREHFINSLLARYGKKIRAVEYFPWPGAADIIERGGKGTVRNKDIQKYKQADIENMLRQKYEISYVAMGYRKNESLQRRGMLTVNTAVDQKYKRLYPIAGWNQKDVLLYLKKNRIPLPPEYRDGFRDITFPKGEALVWLKNRFPEDYALFVAAYPDAEIDYLKAVGKL